MQLPPLRSAPSNSLSLYESIIPWEGGFPITLKELQIRVIRKMLETHTIKQTVETLKVSRRTVCRVKASAR